MSKAFSKVVVIAFMLIAFIGQAFAYSAMSCEMSADSHESHMKMDHSKMAHHEGMNHDEMSSGKAKVENCCGMDCICPASACTSTVVLNSDAYFTDILLLSEAVLLQHIDIPHSVSSSLFRPPIFA